MEFFTPLQRFLIKRCFDIRINHAKFLDPVSPQSRELFCLVFIQTRIFFHHLLISRMRYDFGSLQENAGDHDDGQDDDGIVIHTSRLRTGAL